MFKNQLDGAIEWAEQNCPQVAMLGAVELRRIAKKAIEATGPARTALNLAGSVAGALAGHWLAGIWLEYPYPEWEYIGTVVIATIAVTLVTAVAGQALLHKKIESFADGG